MKTSKTQGSPKTFKRNDSLGAIQEPVYQYVSGNVLEQYLSDKFFLFQAISQGLPYKVFEGIRQFTGITDQEWANILDMSLKSLYRYKQSEKKFKSIHSEKILEVAEASQEGMKFFGSLSFYLQWLHQPSMALGGLKPIQLLSSSYGKDMVVAELQRMQSGVFA